MKGDSKVIENDHFILKIQQLVRLVEQGALMSPNPSGKLKDPANMCVCVLFSCLKLINLLLKKIQGQLNLYFFEKMGFLKGCEISTY